VNEINLKRRHEYQNLHEIASIEKLKISHEFKKKLKPKMTSLKVTA